MKPAKIVLDESWLESEKGNTMVVTDAGSLAVWIKVAKNTYMEITDTPGNSPRFYVGFITNTPAQLRKHIRKACLGWFCVRWNVDDKPPVDKSGDIT